MRKHNDAKAPTVDLTISIGTLGKYEVLERCLRSIYEESAAHFSYEVWVVYNGPGNDGVCGRIRDEFSQARLLECEGPLGFCATHNLVLHQAQSRYMLVLDDDTIISRGTLSTMVAFMDAAPRAGIAGCKTFNLDGSFQPTFGLHPSLRTEIAGIFRAESPMPGWLFEDLTSPRDVDWLNGSFMLVRASALRATGGLDERYYTYICEYDWCYRIRAAGWRVMYFPGAEIVHVGGEHSINTSRTTAKTYSRIVHSHVNRFYFFWKHHGRLTSLALRAIIALQSMTRIIYFSASYLFRPEYAPIAPTRVRAFWRVLCLCFSLEPHRLPREITPG